MKPCGHDAHHEKARGGHRWMEAKIQSSPRARAKRVTVEGCAGLFWCCARCRRRATCFFKFCTALLLLCAPVSLECCRARSQLSNAHTITFQLVRSGENEPPDCLCAIRRSAPSQRGAFWWNFRLIFGSLNRPLEPHWHSLNRKICDL